MPTAGSTLSFIATTESTTSSTFTDLATPGPTATVTVGATGIIFIAIAARMSNNTSLEYAIMSIQASGANTITAADAGQNVLVLASQGNNVDQWQGTSQIITGLTPGSTTFTTKYRRSGGTANFGERKISVLPL